MTELQKETQQHHNRNYPYGRTDLPSLPLCNEPPNTLALLSVWQRKKLLQHAMQVLEAQHKLAAFGGGILHHTRGVASRHQTMTHYPKGDRIDQRTGGQYFYHCHRENLYTREHGHFHCFLRQTAIPKRLYRLPNIQHSTHNAMTHLVGIGMNTLGQPIRLFTLNRWVTDETWYAHQDLGHLLKRFTVKIRDNSVWELIDHWVEGMVQLYALQIQWLHQQRDTLLALANEYPYHESRNIEELSTLSINLAEHIQGIIDMKPQKNTRPTP